MTVRVKSICVYKLINCLKNCLRILYTTNTRQPNSRHEHIVISRRVQPRRKFGSKPNVSPARVVHNTIQTSTAKVVAGLSTATVKVKFVSRSF